MGRVKLTAGRIKEFECKTGANQDFLWDTEAPGLAVRATANGAKSYIFQSKLNGKTIRITIGDVRSWAIDGSDASRERNARTEARNLQSLIDKGIDPRQHRAERIAAAEAKREEAKRQDVTMSEAWAEYIKARAHKWSPRHLADHQKLIQPERVKGDGKSAKRLKAAALASLAPLRLSELNPARVGEWLQQETRERPTQTALAFRLLRAFLNWCEDRPEYRGLASQDSCSRKMGREHLPKKQAKTDCLQREQLFVWFQNVQQIPNPIISAYLQSLLLTGARREELAGLQWDDVDFQWRTMTIRDKVDGERTIPLTPMVASLLAVLPHRTMTVDGKTVPNPWVFSSPTAASGRLQEPSIQHRKACANAGLEGLTLHGLRRSFGTLAEWVECPTGIAAQIMGHKPSATAEKHYRQRPIDLLRMWHTKIEGWILEQAGIEQPQEEAKPGLRVVTAA